MAVACQLPQMNAPIVEADGRATFVFRQLLRALWVRTGCAKGEANGYADTLGNVASVANVAPIGEMTIWTYGVAVPQDWLLCDGTLRTITELPALYAVIGIRYGGDGVSTFALPNLPGPPPIAYIIRSQ